MAIYSRGVTLGHRYAEGDILRNGRNRRRAFEIRRNNGEVSKERQGIFARHKARSTYEIPGGHRDEGESILETAKRELYEETGAVDFDVLPVAVYKFNDYGMLCLAEVRGLSELPDFEIGSIEFFGALPENLTYSAIQPALFERCAELMNRQLL